MAGRSSSLGPFPRTRRWGDIVAKASGHADTDLADSLIVKLREAVVAIMATDEVADAMAFFVALPVATRVPDPVAFLRFHFNIRYSDGLRNTLSEILPVNGPVRQAALATFDRFQSSPRFTQAQIAGDDWSPWRAIDGSPFCEIARLFWGSLLEEMLVRELEADPRSSQYRREHLSRHAWELSRITQSFSARWYNACAASGVPSRNSIRWFIGHCAGKLDMELERELSTHLEPAPPPSSRHRKEPPSLGLPF